MSSSNKILLSKMLELLIYGQYLIRFFYLVLKGVLRKQKIRIPNDDLVIKRRVLLTEDLKAKWDNFYGISNQAKINFTYFSQNLQIIMFHFLERLGVNYCNLLHLEHEALFADGNTNIAVNEIYFLETTLKDIYIFMQDKAIIELESTIKDRNGNRVVAYNDRLYVKKLAKEDIDLIINRKDYKDTKKLHLTKVSKRKTLFINDFDQSVIDAFHFSSGLGLRYGLLSGDMNPIHTIKMISRIFGYKKPFVQGLYVVNLINKTLSERKSKKITHLKVTFSRPIILDEAYILKADNSVFELLDSKSNVIVFGEYY